MGINDYGDMSEADVGDKEKVFKEFDCPICSANNPYDDGFSSGDEIRCFYCGAEFKVKVNDSGKLKLKET